MKVYKVVSHQDVERSTTLEGWELMLDHTQVETQAEPVNCKTPMTINQGTSYSSVQSYCSQSVGQFSRPLYLLSKDEEVVKRESSLTAQLVDVNIKMNELKKAYDELTKLADRAENSERASIARCRKMEADIAKLRTAIGDLKFNEIVGSETK